MPINRIEKKPASITPSTAHEGVDGIQQSGLRPTRSAS
jgi:hypothetical protein